MTYPPWKEEILINIDIAVVMTILIFIIGLAAGLGALAERVKTDRQMIESIKNDLQGWCRDNRQDHQNIFNKLETIISSGKSKGE